MTEKNNNLSTVFEGNDVQIIVDENDELLFELYSTGAALGYARPNAKGMMYPRKDRIDTVIENAEISMCVRSGHKYLTESQLYDFMLEAHTDKCKPFRKWVTNEVLPTIRKTGCYITESATTEAIDYQSKYGKYRIRKTFNESTDPRKTYEEFMELSKLERKAKRINNEERIKCCNIIIDTLQTRIADEMLTMRPSELLAIQELVVDIQNDVIKLSNRKNGGKLAAKTKKLNELQDEYDELYELYRMEDANYYLIPRHGFTTNCAYTYDENSGRFVKSKAYQKWISNLNLSDFLPPMYPDINYDKPLRINLGFVCKDEFDVHNLTKTIIDQIANFYEFNDNQIIEARQKKIDNCDNFSDGRIYVKLENVDDID